MIQAILEEGTSRGELALQDPGFAATFAFNALVTAPRHRILRRLAFKNTKAGRRAYLAAAIDVMFAGLALRIDAESSGHGQPAGQ